MNFLLTGGNGFIGRRLTDRLLRDGHFVSVLTRKVVQRPDRNVGQYFWSMQGPAPAEPFRDVDVVIHLAGEPILQRWTKEAKRRIHDSRELGTRHLVEGIARLDRKPPVLISASGIDYYGDRADEMLTESSGAGRGFLTNVCVGWEREADRAIPLGLRVVKIRTGLALHPEGGALKQMLLPFRLGLGARLGSGLQWMSWIHLDDLVELYLYTAQSSIEGAVNGVAPNCVRNDEFTQTLARVLGRPAFLAAPEFAIRLATGDMADVILGSHRVKPEAVQQAGFEFRHARLQEALEALLR